MRVRKRKNLKKKNVAIVMLFLIPIIGFSVYAGFLLYILFDIASFTFLIPAPNTAYFHPLSSINTTHMAQMAEDYEIRLEQYHMPTNISQDIIYTDDTYSAVAQYLGTDNANLHLGYTTAAECMKYYVAIQNNSLSDRLNATRLIKKLVSAYSDFMAAPNGGLGINPDTGTWYPGTLARFVSAPKYRSMHQWLFDPHYKHFNGTGVYKNWRVRLYTSRDELGGFYIGMASVLKFIDPTLDADSLWIVNRVKLLVTQMIEGFRSTNWLLLHGDGTPCGSDLNPVLEGSTWQLALLRIGASADPDRYLSLYHYCAAKMQGMNSASMGDAMGVIGGYYAFSFGLDVMLSLIWLENDPNLRFWYISNYENNFYSVTRYHRNAFFNMAHLIFMTMLTPAQKVQFQNLNYTDATIRWDVLDQLWCFKTSGWEDGVRNYNLTQRPHSTRATSTNPIIASLERVPTKAKWRDFFANNTFGPLFSWLDFEWNFDEGSDHYMVPLNVPEYGVHHWVWEHTKFEGGSGDPSGNGLKEVAPNSFICIYWMAKAYKIF